jgi:hypothetical protein
MRSRLTLGAVAGVAGALVPVVGLVVLPIWDFPATTASASQIAHFVQAHRSALQAVMVLNTIGVSLWSVFGAAVWVRLRQAAHADSALPACFAVGLIGFVTLLMAGFTAFDVLVYRGSVGLEAQVLYDLTFGLLAMSGMPTAVALAAFAVLVVREGVLPGATAGLAAVTAAAHVVLLLSFVIRRGFFSLEGPVITVIPGLLFAWIFVTGIAMLRPAAHD